ncbi:MAG: LacI family DNA-binding transcriptional regulator [Bifidobacteriaceae bacterium]|nr:LacI family DNA-binding transcriptional regulator [Bifidobacteriaceae bacterium]
MTSTIQDVAQKARVSISTVSRAFSRPDLVAEPTREKILRIAEELNFSTSRSAAALKSGKTKRIALLISDHIRSWFTASIIEGINYVLHKEGYDLSIFEIANKRERQNFFQMLPIRRNVDAVIVSSFSVDLEEVQQLASINVPIIGINCTNPQNHQFTGAVNIDDEQGGKLMARHLLTLGHKQIVYVRTNPSQTLQFSVQQRFESFMSACKEANITPHVITTPNNDVVINDIIAQILSLPTTPTAIACQEDNIAIPLIFQLERSGYNIPKDMSVIGYDNSLFAQDIGLTTINQDPVFLGKQAAQKTLDYINGDTPEAYNLIEAQLVIRSSTARV